MQKPIEIGPLLDGIIKETGLTQEEIAAELDYDAVYLSQARKAGTKKLYNRLLAFINDYRKSKLSNKGNSIENQDLKDKLIQQLEKNNAILEQSLAHMEVRLRAVDKAFEQIEIMKGYLNRFEKSHQEIKASLDDFAENQFLFGAVQQGWQEYWSEHLAGAPSIPLREVKEMIRTKVISLLHSYEQKGKEAVLNLDN